MVSTCLLMFCATPYYSRNFEEYYTLIAEFLGKTAVTKLMIVMIEANKEKTQLSKATSTIAW